MNSFDEISRIVSARFKIVNPSPLERWTVLLKKVSLRFWTLKLGRPGASDKFEGSLKDCIITEVPPDA